MPPQNVDILAKGVDCAIWLGHRDHSLGLSMFEGGISLHTKADCNCEVLGPRLIGFHSCRVMVEWFPLPESKMS